MRLLRRPRPTSTTPATISTSATWYVQPAAGAAAVVRAPRAADVAKVA